MNIKSQVCSLELSQRLKELGLKLDSYWHWGYYPVSRASYYKGTITRTVSLSGMEWKLVTIKPSKSTEYYSAPTCGEFGEILPEHIEKDDEIYSLRIWKNGDSWEVLYTYHLKGEWLLLHCVRSDNLAEAFGLMAEYLLKNKLMEGGGKSGKENYRRKDEIGAEAEAGRI